VTHAELQSALAELDIAVDAAEAHGRLTGALCSRAGFGAREWLADLDADRAGPLPEPSPELRRLPAWTLEVLESDAFEFEPLVPGEAAPLAERVSALAAWSDGFLYGVGSGAPDPAVLKSGDVGEFLHDLGEIARAELEPGRGSDAGESDYAELFEFVRAGAQLTYDELAGARSNAKG
jgi:uncharacterized protein